MLQEVKEASKKVNSAIKHWYVPLIVGILSVIVGIWTISTPVESFLALAIIFTVFFVIGGSFEIFYALSNKDQLDHWGWELTTGILTLVIGILLVLNPAVTLITFPFYVSFVVLFRSAMAISSAIEVKKYGVKDWGILLTFGILGMILGFIMLWHPVFAGLTIVIWTGIAFFTLGIFAIFLSFKIKKLHTLGSSDK